MTPRQFEELVQLAVAWATEQERIILQSGVQLAEGMFVYALRTEYRDGQPEHFLCPHCFEQKKRSILRHPVAGNTNYLCHACEFEIDPEPFTGIGAEAFEKPLHVCLYLQPQTALRRFRLSSLVSVVTSRP